MWACKALQLRALENCSGPLSASSRAPSLDGLSSRHSATAAATKLLPFTGGSCGASLYSAPLLEANPSPVTGGLPPDSP
eukprot:scaffold282219_cov33-Tisochrysis_lutea.AAC.2